MPVRLWESPTRFHEDTLSAVPPGCDVCRSGCLGATLAKHGHLVPGGPCQHQFADACRLECNSQRSHVSRHVYRVWLSNEADLGRKLVARVVTDHGIVRAWNSQHTG